MFVPFLPSFNYVERALLFDRGVTIQNSGSL